MNLKAIKLEKKYRYLLYSILAGLLFYFLPGMLGKIPFFLFISIVVAFTAAGTTVVHYPNVKLVNLVSTMLLPLSLVTGALMSLYYFPNFSLPFKLVLILGFSSLFYLVLLVDNIFLVIHDREEVIPLYRVALTWSQILEVVVAIPLFAGIFKLSANGIIQSLFVAVVAFMFSLYLVGVQKFDKDSKDPGVGEILTLCLVVFVIVLCASISVSFMPTEPFLRSLMVSATLLFGLIYVNAHLKNEISKPLIIEYLIIILVFFSLILFFIP